MVTKDDKLIFEAYKMEDGYVHLNFNDCEISVINTNPLTYGVPSYLVVKPTETHYAHKVVIGDKIKWNQAGHTFYGVITPEIVKIYYTQEEIPNKFYKVKMAPKAVIDSGIDNFNNDQIKNITDILDI